MVHAILDWYSLLEWFLSLRWYSQQFWLTFYLWHSLLGRLTHSAGILVLFGSLALFGVLKVCGSLFTLVLSPQMDHSLRTLLLSRLGVHSLHDVLALAMLVHLGSMVLSLVMDYSPSLVLSPGNGALKPHGSGRKWLSLPVAGTLHLVGSLVLSIGPLIFIGTLGV